METRYREGGGHGLQPGRGGGALFGGSSITQPHPSHGLPHSAPTSGGVQSGRGGGLRGGLLLSHHCHLRGGRPAGTGRTAAAKQKTHPGDDKGQRKQTANSM